MSEVSVRVRDLAPGGEPRCAAHPRGTSRPLRLGEPSGRLERGAGRQRSLTGGERATLGLTMQAGPGGCNGCSDPRRWESSFCKGQWKIALVNPTSVNAHLAEIRALPADIVVLAETALTAGGQKRAWGALQQGDRGLTAVWGAPQPQRKTAVGAPSD